MPKTLRCPAARPCANRPRGGRLGVDVNGGPRRGRSAPVRPHSAALRQVVGSEEPRAPRLFTELVEAARRLLQVCSNRRTTSQQRDEHPALLLRAALADRFALQAREQAEGATRGVGARSAPHRAPRGATPNVSATRTTGAPSRRRAAAAAVVRSRRRLGGARRRRAGARIRPAASSRRRRRRRCVKSHRTARRARRSTPPRSTRRRSCGGTCAAAGRWCCAGCSMRGRRRGAGRSSIFGSGRPTRPSRCTRAPTETLRACGRRTRAARAAARCAPAAAPTRRAAAPRRDRDELRSTSSGSSAGTPTPSAPPSTCRSTRCASGRRTGCAPTRRRRRTRSSRRSCGCSTSCSG